MLLIKLLILAVLLLIFIQDILSRSVYWILFPVLAVLLTIIRVTSHQTWSIIGQSLLINNTFLALQLLLVSAWFSLKQGKWINITSQLLGWGDVLFLICVSFYLSVLNFLFFYISSLVSVLIMWLGRQLFVGKKDKQIPLAGFQAILFILFLTNSWWLIHLDLTNDDWLFNVLTKWI